MTGDLEKLRFIQRVLEGNPPQSDKDASLAMVRELRASWYANGNPRQRAALALMREKPERDLYEGAGPGGREGSGNYWVTYSAGVPFEPLSKEDVQELVERGLIVEKWTGCYRLANQ